MTAADLEAEARYDAAAVLLQLEGGGNLWGAEVLLEFAARRDKGFAPALAQFRAGDVAGGADRMWDLLGSVARVVVSGQSPSRTVTFLKATALGKTEALAIGGEVLAR
ncbi:MULTISPECIES: hypothetical protein [Roseomonadaceae]|uniref:Uncharacterized protein n=1 Tax=Falsiroseomonas oleicola TaxID=2801474 RepID=A0ABS6H6J8_9PROT|nr:hypothetical protein [Roseomonas oleicola]MBU8543981.1 hypothetical protein [Roseomonas oleicola]